MFARLSLATAVLVVVVAGTANAATVSVTGTTATYVAAGGEANAVVAHFNFDGTLTVRDSGAGIAAGAGCTPQSDGSVICAADTGVTYADVNLGDGDDRASLDDFSSGSGDVSGGPGDDEISVGTSAWGMYTVSGDQGNDTLRSSVNFSGAATLSGGRGSDTLNAREDGGRTRLYGGEGPDALSWTFGAVIDGGLGDDTYRFLGRSGSLVLSAVAPGPGRDTFDGSGGAPLTLDLATCGGCAQRVIGSSFNDTIMGAGGAEAIDGGDGNDTIDPRGGADVVAGSDGDDTIDSRDGSTDTVTCGDGTDTVTADQRDKIAADCETVSRGLASRGTASR